MRQGVCRLIFVLLLMNFVSTHAASCNERELISGDGKIHIKIQAVSFNRHLWCFVRGEGVSGVRKGSGFSLPPIDQRGFDSPKPQPEQFTESSGIFCARDLDSTVLIKATYRGKAFLIEDRWVDGSPYRRSRWMNGEDLLKSSSEPGSVDFKWRGGATLDRFNGQPYSLVLDADNEFEGRRDFVLKNICGGAQ